ncbi:helix-turn-helix transcriptional regulator [Candidatus Peregrinibacteria bacterium]|nr:MAG: helix-turn-helix transcriptional regulator [Candidatus Peregrinibacteria bacterium]
MTLQQERTIGQKIKAWRNKKELTQDALARKADIPYTTLAKIESDVIKSPTLPTATKIAAGLGITLDELIS